MDFQLKHQELCVMEKDNKCPHFYLRLIWNSMLMRLVLAFVMMSLGENRCQKAPKHTLKTCRACA